MPSHTRGKIKEHLEGVHRNCESTKLHCAKSLGLIADKSPEWSEAFGAIVALTNNLDELAQAFYSRI